MLAVDQTQTEEPRTRAERLLATMRNAMRGRLDMDLEEVYWAPNASFFDTDDDGKLDYLPAPDLDVIAHRLIGRYEEFKHLKTIPIIYLWKREGGKSHSHVRLGCCVKPSGLVKHFGEGEWIIWLAADHTNLYKLTRHQVEAMVYHELLHAGQDDGKPKLNGHDVEMFAAEVKRYGLWKNDIKRVAHAFEQLAFLDGGAIASRTQLTAAIAGMVARKVDEETGEVLSDGGRG